MFEAIKNIIKGINTGLQPETQDELTVNLALTVLLFDAAYADGECSDQEKAHLTDTLVTHFQVPREEIDTLVADREKQREEHVELFRYTRFLNDHFSEDQKKVLLESVWRIILIDGHLEAHEDHFAHRLSDLLNLSHKDLIDAKLRARDQLA
jgi:uncharacterized tellurite resistance protein B-like protein